VSEAPDPKRARVYVAVVLGVGLVVAVLVVLLAGGGDDDAVAEADPECIEAWNDDQTIVSFGQHQFNGHGYERVQVLRVNETGEPTDSAEGRCAVVFAATNLDPEPGARGQVFLDGKWTGFEALESVTEEEIAQLQADAFSQANSSLSGDGTLQAVSS
jgi:hypothetical protein